VTDAKPASALTASLDALQDLAIDYYLGEHPSDLLDSTRLDLLVVSPGVPLTSPFLQQAQAAGLLLTTESRLFSQFCPAPIVGISGSSGKTTTTTLVGLMLEASGFTTHVGGNIGTPMISRLDEIKPTDRVVMELSSFQLEYFHPSPVGSDQLLPGLNPLLRGFSPQVGALLNITPNHLDRHGTMAAYTQAKMALLQSMGPDQVAVLNLDNEATRNTAKDQAATINWFSQEQLVAAGTCLIDDQFTLVRADQMTPICSTRNIRLRGEHNIYNMLAACAIATAAGATPAAMTEVATSFTGVAHRLEQVAVHNGVAFYNDSIATSQERMIAALKSFEDPIILLAGVKDKDLQCEEAARMNFKQVKNMIF
jgi:UDP-N-acetylmuramoylalanine--D-glutamate ligase